MMSLLLAFSTKSYSPVPVFLSAHLPAMSDRRICYPRSVDSESTPPVDALARIQAPNYEPYDVSMPDDKRPRASLATAAAGAHRQERTGRRMMPWRGPQQRRGPGLDIDRRERIDEAGG